MCHLTVNSRVQLLCVSRSATSPSFQYLPIQRIDLATKRYAPTTAIIVQSDSRYRQFHCLSLDMLITLQNVSNSSVRSIHVNPTTSVPDSTKSQDNDQNESNHSSNLKDIELVLNTSKNHRVKRGHGITDSLPGIRKNRYGYGMAYSCFVEIC